MEIAQRAHCNAPETEAASGEAVLGDASDVSPYGRLDRAAVRVLSFESLLTIILAFSLNTTVVI